MHISHDAGSFHDFMIANPFFANEHPDYLLVSNTVLPMLREAGVPDEAIDEMLVANPQRFFSG